MLLNSNWRILTVGDGDLSFSASLARHHTPAHLTASVYDPLETLKAKYSSHGVDECRALGVPVLDRFDVTEKACWQELEQHTFDVVIFQFPLLPGFSSNADYKAQTRGYDLNTLNRALLHTFIRFANHYALDPQGPALCYITSKDVKPYREWNLEHTLVHGLDVDYLGQMPFEASRFPGYRVRNVDRDKHVKDTSGTTYVFGRTLPEFLRGEVSLPAYLSDDHCAACRAGPFMTKQDWDAHLTAKKHTKVMRYEALWQRWLSENG